MAARVIEVTEVGLRDGLQAEARIVPTADKVAVFDALVEAGVRRFEVSSFVSPRAVPQLADAAEILAGITRRPGLTLACLVPNEKGAERAIAARVDEMVTFVSASESHNRTNVNRPIEDSLRGFAEVARMATAHGIVVHGAIATAFGCPFEGDVAPARVVEIVGRMAAIGIRGVTLGDTTGMATPPIVRSVCGAIAEAHPEVAITLHFHNTRGIGLVNVMAGLDIGITRFESSIGGLGGCPFAPGATGNVSTEDLVYLLDETGEDTGIALAKLLPIARRMEELVGHPLPGQLMKAGPRLALYPLESVRRAVG